MTANSIEQIVELLDDGFTSCEVSKYAMKEIKDMFIKASKLDPYCRCGVPEIRDNGQVRFCKSCGRAERES